MAKQQRTAYPKKLRYLMIALTISLTALLTLAGTLFYWPKLILNDYTLGHLALRLRQNGTDLSWRQSKFAIDRHALFDRSFHWAVEDLCFRKKPMFKRICFEKLELAVQVELDHWFPRITSMGPLDARGGTIKIVLPNTSSQESNTSPKNEILIPSLALPSFFKKTAIKPFYIEVASYELRNGIRLIKGDLNIKTFVTKINALDRTEILATVHEGSQGLEAQLEGVISSPTFFRNNIWETRLTVQGTRGSDNHISATGRFSKTTTDKMINGDVTTNLKSKSQDLSINTALRIQPHSIETRVEGTLLGIHKEVSRLQLKRCNATLKRPAKVSDDNLSLDCVVLASLHPHKLKQPWTNIYNHPEQLSAILQASFAVPFLPDPRALWKGVWHFQIAPTKTGLLTAQAQGQGTFEGIPDAKMATWKVTAIANAHAELNRFAALIPILEGTAYAIPAPFHVLDGLVSIDANARLLDLKGIAELPINLNTRLTSAQQRMHVDATAHIRMPTKHLDRETIDVKAMVELTDVMFELPNISIGSIPQFQTDRRITLTGPQKTDASTQEGKPTKGPGFNYEVDIQTPPNMPLQLRSNRTGAPIPIHSDVKLVNGQANGTLRIGSTPLKLFRRDATLTKFMVNLRAPLEISEIDGSVGIHYADYNITIGVAGTVGRPKILFESDPPLGEDDILSVLLYGEPLTELDSTQSSSVGQMSAALTDRALALTSLYLLASTPIQRVGYNPETGSVSARLKLGEQTSLFVGGGKEEKEIGLHRRLGKGWFITTSLQNPNDSTKTKGSAFLEWHKRY